MSSPIIIATRGSALALAQATMVQAQCRAAFPGLSFELKIIKTTGDKLQTASLASSELPKGLFTKEIEEALVRDEADLAVHSLKDLPTELPEGLILGAVLPREDVRDVLVCHANRVNAPISGRAPSDQGPGILAVLPPGAVVATSSTRRRAQLLDFRPDLKVVSIRGNVDTRLRKLKEQQDLHATLLACAGLKRLGFRITPEGALLDERPAASRSAKWTDTAGILAFPLPAELVLPCVGQAAIGIETKASNPRVTEILKSLDDVPTHYCVDAERGYLSAMGGGCQLAVAAWARLESGSLRLQAVSFLGEKPARGEITGEADLAVELGRTLAQRVGSQA
jgi:hydroxymethylbilane synthase